MDSVRKLSKAIYLKVNAARTAKRFTWAELIRELKKLGVKCNVNTPYDWKAGKSSSYLECMPEISKVLDISKEELSDLVAECFTNNFENSFNGNSNSTITISTRTQEKASRQASEVAKIFDGLSLENQYKLLGIALGLRDEK